MISHPYSTPRDMMDIIDFLIPELQRRGLYRTRYDATTLRGNLGLPFRESRYARKGAAAASA